MKQKIKTMMFGVLISGIIMCNDALAQTKPEAAVMGIDSKGIIQDAEAVGYMVRLELEKTNVFNVMDKYDVAEIVSKNNIDLNACFGKNCVTAAGKVLNVDKIITGSVERFDEKIVIALKLIDVGSEAVEKQDATEYLNLQPELQKMIGISVQKLLGITPDQNLVNLLIDYDAPVESPKTQIRLNGPRMGAAFTFGDAASVLMAKEGDGGFNMFPLMFQIGWQQEWQYLSAGNFQALVEVLPMISGLESGKFIPSVSFLNGFRFGRGGWEFAVGPSFRFVRKAEGFFDEQNILGGEAWHLTDDWNYTILGPNPYPLTKRLDSRGSGSLSTRLIIGIGKTFKSGYLNIPVNVYVAPDRQGTSVGFSFGFNIYKKPKVR
ncbi:MAG TPA: hypothetical protein VI583_04170 [Cyclobacteriaceae bacterium]|nr:hypothetical protein [Cyclobacteriaceae bacterium]